MKLMIRAITALLLLYVVACSSVNNDTPQSSPGAEINDAAGFGEQYYSGSARLSPYNTEFFRLPQEAGLSAADAFEPPWFISAPPQFYPLQAEPAAGPYALNTSSSLTLPAASHELTTETALLITTLVDKPWQLTPREKALDDNAGVTEKSANQDQQSGHQQTDLWLRIRQGFSFSKNKSNAQIQREIKKYSVYHRDFYRTLQRSEPFLYFIVQEAEKRSIPLEIALLPVVESAFNPFAYSPLRAAGIWQFIPNTGKFYGLKQTWWYDGRRDVITSTRAAFKYLNYLYDRFDRDWLLALAAYNAGSGTVSRAIRRNKNKGKPTDFWHLRLPGETKAYVPRLLAVARIVAEPGRFGVRLPPIANKPVFAVVDVESQIDLPKAATLAGISVDDLFLFNPGFKQWATDPLGPHTLAIPTDRVSNFKTRLAELPSDQRVAWQRYVIKSGDNLSVIASKHNISVALLKDFNRLKGNTIRAGRALLIPNPRVLGNESQGNLLADLEASPYFTSRAAEAKRQRKLVYRVRKGDTLWDISRKFHVNTRKLAQWNNMAPAEVLRSGRRLTIWQKIPSGRPADLQLASNLSQLRRIDYKVKKGDSLYRIANKYRVTIRDLLQWNTLSRRSFLHPGQSLSIYVNVARLR